MNLPDLDTVSFEAFRHDLVAAIPRYTEQWTDFNPSDPGITLVELLAWIAENQLFQINELPDTLYLNFLKLLAGADEDEIPKRIAVLKSQRIEYGSEESLSKQSEPPLYLDPDYIALLEYLEAIRQGAPYTREEIQHYAAAFINSPYRAITQSDFETLSIKATAPLTEADEKVARASVYTSDEQVSVVILTGYEQPYDRDWNDSNTAVLVERDDKGDSAQSLIYDQLTEEVSRFLAPRILTGSVFSVLPPFFTPVFIRLVIRCEDTAQPKAVLNASMAALFAYFDLLSDQANKQVWSYNEPINGLDLKTMMDHVPGVAYIDTFDISTGFFQLGVFSTVGVDTYIGPIPENAFYPVSGFPRIERMELSIIGDWQEAIAT